MSVGVNPRWSMTFLLVDTRTSQSSISRRLAVGLIFLTQGILKYIDPNMGVIRFAKIGFRHPYFTAHFVGAFPEEFPMQLAGELSVALWRDGASWRPRLAPILH